MNPLMLLPGLVQADVGLYQTLQANKQARLARREAAGLVDPTLSVSNYYEDLFGVYANRIGQGLSDNTLATLTGGINQNAASSLSTLLQSGVGANIGSQLIGGIGDAYARLAQADEQQHNLNIQAAAAAATQLAEAREKEFYFNEFRPIQDKKQALAQLSKDAYSNRANGISAMLGGLGNMGTAMLYGLNKTNQINPEFDTPIHSPVTIPRVVAPDLTYSTPSTIKIPNRHGV